MCLSIHIDQPKNSEGQFIPYVTKRDYIVWKRITQQINWMSNETEYVTPFQHMHVVFSKAFRAKMASQRPAYSAYVTVGLHAHLRKRERHMRYGNIWVPCVIPAGSSVYYGESNEIVSNALIIFKDMDQLNAYYAR